MPQGFEVCRVSAVRLMSSQVRNVTIAAESLAGFAFEPGADVAIRLPRGDGGADERHYSVWKSTAEGKFDVISHVYLEDTALPRSPGPARASPRQRPAEASAR